MSEAAPTKTATWVKILLGVSLSLNLLILGAVGATIWKFSGARAGPDTRGGGLAPLVRALPEADRQALRETYRATHTGQEEAERRKADFLAALRAEPFDAEAFDAMLLTHAEEGAARMAAGREALVSSVAQMSPEARAAYADRIERMMERAERRRSRSSR